MTGVEQLVIAKVFRMELEDPVRGRKLAQEYRIEALPVEG